MSASKAITFTKSHRNKNIFKILGDTPEFRLRSYYNNIPMDNSDKLKDKFKNVSAVSFTTYGNDLMICFNGFEEEQDAKEFADFIFAKIKMKYSTTDDIPKFH